MPLETRTLSETSTVHISISALKDSTYEIVYQGETKPHSDTEQLEELLLPSELTEGKQDQICEATCS